MGIGGYNSNEIGETITDDNKMSYRDKAISLIFIHHHLNEWFKMSKTHLFFWE